MAKLLFGLMACVAAFVMVDSLTCNKCSIALFGLCLNSGTETCTGNSTVCYTGKLTFPSLTSFNGFTSLGCREPAGCNVTSNATLVFVTAQTQTTCCSTDKCNNGASSAKMTVTGVISAAVLASVWGSMSL